MYILVDTESVGISSLDGIEKLSCNDMVVLFIKSRIKRLQYSHGRLQKLGAVATIKRCDVLGSKLNSQLVGSLGVMIGLHRNLSLCEKYYIISRNSYYRDIVNLLNYCVNDIKIECFGCISSLIEYCERNRCNNV